jgi:hypothetical protein
MALTADIQRALEEGGARILLTRSLRKLLRPAVKIGTLVFAECDLSEPMPERRPVPGIILREATVDDAYLFEDRNVFLQRLEQRNRCFIGIEEATGKLAQQRWVNTSSAYVPELKRWWILRPGEAYAYDLKTMPEFRKRGIDGYSRHHTYSYLRDIGYTRVVAYIHGDNGPSLRASRHFLKPICRIRYVQLRGCNPIIIGGWQRGSPDFGPITA